MALPRTAAWQLVLSCVAAAWPGLQGDCPKSLRDPYMEEPSPFGWPVAPNDWDFDHQQCWGEKHVVCNGVQQSPMDISTGSTGDRCSMEVAGSDGALDSKGRYWEDSEVHSEKTVKVSKYMRTVMVNGSFGTLTLKDAAGRDVEYDAVQVHLTPDSFHTIGGHQKSAEMLVVHKARGARDEMLSSSVIVSVLFELSPGNHSSPIFAQLGLGDGGPISTEPGQAEPAAWTAAPFGVASTIKPALRGPSYLYNGSVPVPPCSETVSWFVLEAVQPVSVAHIQKLKMVLGDQAGGWKKRTPVPRHPQGGACREIVKNGFQLGGSHEEPTCAQLAAQGLAAHTARCWEDAGPACAASPVDVRPGAAIAPVEPAGVEFMHYEAPEHVAVAPSTYTLDATPGHSSFGHLLLNGRMFEAKKIMIKPISSHTMNGTRYAGELMIEHRLFGDDMDGHAGSTPAGGHGESTEATPASASGGHGEPRHLSSSGPAGGHTVMVSVPLKLGAESGFLRGLGLGDPAKRQAIRDGHSYGVHEAVDIDALLAPSFAGRWFWYHGSPALPGCPEWGVRWMVFETPEEMSLEQLNYLALPVSGVDSTRPAQAAQDVWRQSMPAHAVEAAGHEGDCHGPWGYSSVHCWAVNHSTCSAGQAQSPINIKGADVAAVGVANFLANASWIPVRGLKVENTGRALKVSNDQMGYFMMTGQDGYPDYYQALELVLHMPSEHMINDKHFAAELQVVHKRQIAVNDLDSESLAIASFMFDISPSGEESGVLKQFHLPGGVAPDAPEAMGRPLDLLRAFGPALEGPFFRYDGSETTPGCAERVKWFVFETPTMMSQGQWDAFRAMFGSPGNSRPVQPLAGRRLAKNSFDGGEPVKWEFFLNRRSGRNRYTPDETLIVIPVVGAILLALALWLALFVREDRARKETRAGGLESGGLERTIGRPQQYSQL